MTSDSVEFKHQFTLVKTTNSRRRRLKVRRLRYTCRTNTLSPGYNKEIGPTISSNTKTEISLLLTQNNAVEIPSRVVSYGTVSVIGRRKEMEDAVRAELGFVTKGEVKYDFFGVYDGHGGRGVAERCRERLHEVVAEEMEVRGKGGVEWERVMERSFERMDEEVVEERIMGSTAVVAVVGKEEVVVGNCGDSRAVVYSNSVAIPLSLDHKPDRADELERIEAAGGRVINWNGKRVLGVLATSRSIGDEYLKPYIISKPEVKVIKLKENDEFLILASDGLWDVVSNKVACQVVKKCLSGGMRRISCQQEIVSCKSRAAEAAAVLTELAMARGSQDNISVIVVELSRS